MGVERHVVGGRYRKCESWGVAKGYKVKERERRSNKRKERGRQVENKREREGGNAEGGKKE